MAAAAAMSMLACAHVARSPLGECNPVPLPMESASAVDSDASGNLLIVGSQMTALSLDAVGATRWRAQLGEGDDNGFFALLLPEGDAVVGGWLGRHPFIARLRGSDGSLVWKVSLPGDGLLRAAVPGKPGLWALGTHTHGPDTPYNPLLVRFDPLSGAVLEERDFPSPGNEQARAIALRPDGSIVFVGELTASFDTGSGELQSAGDTDAYVVSLGSWAKSYGGRNNDEYQALQLGPDGSAFVAGHTQPSDDYGKTNPHAVGTFQALIARYTTDGTLAWSHAFSGGQSMFLGMRKDAAGNLWTAGHLRGEVELAGARVNTDPGKRSWVAVFNADGELRQSQACDHTDQANAIALVPGGAVLVGMKKSGAQYTAYLWRAVLSP